jgi:hypothetical protein
MFSVPLSFCSQVCLVTSSINFEAFAQSFDPKGRPESVVPSGCGEFGLGGKTGVNGVAGSKTAERKVNKYE